jgi:hypothetical protein
LIGAGQKTPATIAQMNPRETQTAAMFSLAAQPKFEVMFMAVPYLNGEER